MMEVYDCSGACVGLFESIKDFVEKYYFTESDYKDWIADNEINYPLPYEDEVNNYVDIIEKDISYADYPIANFSGFRFVFKEGR